MKSFTYALVLTLMSLSANAALMMKPGKWRIQSTITRDGKVQESPQAKMQAAMKSMTPEKRKEMEAMMGKMKARLGQDKAVKGPQFGFDEKGMTMCYTKEMLESGLGTKEQHEKQKCKISDHVQTPKLVSMKFTCENGSSGSSEWKVIDETHMTGTTKMVSTKGSKMETHMKAEFLSSKCD